MKILAIIPARGGSKGVPKKNIAKIVIKKGLAKNKAVAVAKGIIVNEI